MKKVLLPPSAKMEPVLFARQMVYGHWIMLLTIMKSTETAGTIACTQKSTVTNMIFASRIMVPGSTICISSIKMMVSIF